jgi:hypothetical protein
MAERYGLLPSEVLSRATTLDIAVMDISLSYQKMQQDRSTGKVPTMSQDAMKALLEKAKG